MTDRLINSFNSGDNINVTYTKNDDTKHPCIVDISNCITIEHMLINIENFRTCNYNSEDVDVITNFNTENCIEVTNEQNKIYKTGYFDFYNLDDKSNIRYYCNLYINDELIVQNNITAFSDHNVFSDSNLKYDFYKIENSLENIEKLKPVSFHWKHNDEYEIGFIANELEQLFP